LNIRAHAEESDKCQGNECLQVLSKRIGTRCNTTDSLDVVIQNVSDKNLRGWVVFELPGGKKGYSPTGLMHPGEKQDGPQFTCHSNGEVSVLANIGDNPQYPPKTDQNPSSGDSQLGASEFGSGSTTQNGNDVSNDNPVSPTVQAWKRSVGTTTAMNDGLYTVPVPEYDYYSFDATLCSAVTQYGKVTARYALFSEMGSVQFTVKNHVIVSEINSVQSHFTGCVFPEQVQGNSKYHFHTTPAVIGNRG
jgi:hypothetical protein